MHILHIYICILYVYYMHELITKNIEVSQDQTYCLWFSGLFFHGWNETECLGLSSQNTGSCQGPLPTSSVATATTVVASGFPSWFARVPAVSPKLSLVRENMRCFLGKKQPKNVQKKNNFFCNSHSSDMKYRSSGDIEYTGTVDAVATLLFPPKVDN